MIDRKLLSTLTLALAILSMTGIAALANGSHKVQVYNPATVSGTQLTPGTYALDWEAPNTEVAGEYKASMGTPTPEITVRFIKDKKVVATAHGKLVDRDVTYNRDAVIYTNRPDGTAMITEIRFKNMKQVLVLSE
jgi:hypothetical protein